jgi:hypothetical protein
MYNSDMPTRAELPSTRQLIRSTIIALVAAIVLLVTVVLPAEHGIDPTGIGRVLQLTEMGEIKTQLAAEAEADRLRDSQQTPEPQPAPDQRSGLFGKIVATFLIAPAAANESYSVAQAQKSDETVFTLKPTEGVEYKLTMAKGARVDFNWSVQAGVVNYDMHGTPRTGGKEKSYKTGRAVKGDAGVLTAEFDGAHGWFWRNRGKETVTVTLRTTGDYADIKKMN